MLKEKGYDTALALAKTINSLKIKNIKFHFAGGWTTQKDRDFFNCFVRKNNLESLTVYHGLVLGKEKMNLFKNSHIFLFPSRYEKEVFPLSILEALSYGLPVLSFDAGAVSDIINENIGIISNEMDLFEDFKRLKNDYINNSTFMKCRNAFLEKYTVDVFEKNLLHILKGDFN